MTQTRPRRNPHANSTAEHSPSRPQRASIRPLRERQSKGWTESSNQVRSASPALTTLIEQDSPLQAHSGLVLMYGPFQAEMLPQEGQGVASWLRECVRKHGIPSLVRFDYRRRAQVYRRDQFQPWLEPLISKIPS